MKKRFVSIITCVMLSLTALFTIGFMNVFATDDGPVISVEQKVVASGEEFNVSVAISENTGIAGVKFSLAFDSEVINPVLESNLPVYTTDLDGVSSVNIANGKINYIWANAENFTTDGELVSFKFEAVETAYAVTNIQVESVSVYDASEADVAVSTANSKCYVAEFPVTGTQTSSETDGKFAIRFVGKIRSEIKDLLLVDGNSFGFTYKFTGEGVENGTERSFTCQSLMHTIAGNNHVQSEQGGVDGYDYFALTVYNVPVNINTAEYSVWVIIDGVTFTTDVGAVSIAPAV